MKIKRHYESREYPKVIHFYEASEPGLKTAMHPEFQLMVAESYQQNGQYPDAIAIYSEIKPVDLKKNLREVKKVIATILEYKKMPVLDEINLRVEEQLQKISSYLRETKLTDTQNTSENFMGMTLLQWVSYRLEKIFCW